MTVITNNTYSNLSLRAIGVLTIMRQSCAEMGEDKLAFDAIQRLCSDSTAIIKTALKELEERECVLREDVRDSHGRFRVTYRLNELCGEIAAVAESPCGENTVR